MQIEPLEPQWASPTIQEYADTLLAEITKAMIVPEHMMRSAETYALAQRRAWMATEIMRRELVRLTIEFCQPRWAMLIDSSSIAPTEKA